MRDERWETVRWAALAMALVTIILTVGGCSDNQMAARFGGTMEVKLEPGEKLVNATWKLDQGNASLWLLTRQARHGEPLESYVFRERSALGIVQGRVLINETPFKIEGKQ